MIDKNTAMSIVRDPLKAYVLLSTGRAVYQIALEMMTVNDCSESMREKENEEPEELAFIRYADIKGLIKNI